jgi:preprotein translocase subunit SecE
MLQQWIDDRRADEKQRRRLEAKVSEWIERGRGTAGLLGDMVLAETIQWMQGGAARESGDVAELSALVAASQRELDKMKWQRRQQSLRGSVMVAVFAAVISLLAGRCGVECGAKGRRSETPGHRSERQGTGAKQRCAKGIDVACRSCKAPDALAAL